MVWDAGSIESRLEVDTRPFAAGLENAKRKAEEFADKRYTTTVDIDTKRSSDELAAVEQRLHSIESSVDRISSKSGGGSGGGRGGLLGRFAGANVPNPSGLMLGLGAALPLGAPFAALAGGIAGGAASAGATSLLGGAAFGVAAKANLTTITGDITRLNKLTAQYNAATTDKQRATVLAKEQTLWKSLDPAQRGAVKNVQGLDAAWASYKKKLEPQSFRVIGDGAKLAETGLNYLLPVAKAVGDEIDTLAKRAERGFKAPFWHQFFGDFLPGEASRGIGVFGTSLGHLVTGGARLVEQFSPLAHTLEDDLGGLSARFDKWTQGSGPDRFVTWAEKNGPGAAKALDALAKSVTGLAVGFAPLGQIELKILTPVLTAIGDFSKAHPTVIKDVGLALLTVGAGLKAINLAQGAAGVLSKIPGLGGRGGGGGITGKAADALAGRGSSPANPLYVFVVDKAPGGHTPGGVGKTVKTVVDDVKNYGPGATAAGWLLRSRAGSLAVKGLTAGADIADPALLASALAGSDSGPKGADRLRRQLQGLLGNFHVAGGQVYGPSGQVISGPAAHAVMLGTQPQPLSKISNNFLTLDKFGGVAVPDSGPAKRELALLIATLQGDAIKGGATVGDSLNRGVDKQVRARLTATVGPHFAGSIAQIARNAATAAGIGGQTVGQALDDGVARGIEGRKSHVLAAAGKLTSQAVGEMQRAGLISSPSRKTIPIGTALAQGVEVGFTGYSATLLKSFNGATQKVIAGLGTQLNNAANQYRSDLQARSQAGASIASSLMGGASIANASLSNTGGATVSGFLGGQVSQMTTFRGLIDRLKAKKLDAALLQQIVDAGPQQGTTLAQQILSGGASISGLNRQERQLTSLTNSIGGTVAGASYSHALAQDSRQIITLLTQLVRVGMKFSPGDRGTFVRELGQEIARSMPSLNLSDLDRALGIRLNGVR